MADVGQTLYELQQTDLAIGNNDKRLKAIALALANQQPVKKAQATVAKAEAYLKPLQTDLRDLELQVQTNKQKQKSSEQRLYSGTVSNPKELQDIENNIASLKRWQDELEDKMLELMLAIEEGQERLNAANQQLEQALKTSETTHKELLDEKQTLESENKSLKTERNSLVSDVDADALRLYEQLAPRMAQRPVAMLTKDNTCSICGVQQTSIHAQEIRRTAELSRCANCNRILIAP